MHCRGQNEGDIAIMNLLRRKVKRCQTTKEERSPATAAEKNKHDLALKVRGYVTDSIVRRVRIVDIEEIVADPSDASRW
jgi:Ser-tRNA(Ala) deacylase AlaX